MEDLNEQIRVKEKDILNKEEQLAELKRSYEVELLKEVFVLENRYSETKEKELSTIQKRETMASKEEHISLIKGNMEILDLEIRMDKIDLRYLERRFKILFSNKD